MATFLIAASGSNKTASQSTDDDIQGVEGIFQSIGVPTWEDTPEFLSAATEFDKANGFDTRIYRITVELVDTTTEKSNG